MKRSLRSTSRFALVALAGCAPASPPLSVVAKVPPACAISGRKVTLETVKVQPEGAEPFELGLLDVPVVARLPREAGPVQLEVGGAVAFTASRENVWFNVTSKLPGDQVSLARGAQVIDVHQEGDAVLGSAVLYADDVLPGENKRPQELVTPVELPCAALTLDQVEAGDDQASADEGSWWKPREGQTEVELRSGPSQGTQAVRLASPDCEGCLALELVREQGDWLLVQRSGQGVRARGWARRGALERMPDGEGGLRSYGCYGDHGGGGMWGEGGVKRPGDYEGPGVIRAGTQIYAAPGQGAWGRVTADLETQVRHSAGEPWVELRAIPGLDGSPPGSPWLHAFVPVDQVSF